MKFMLKKFNLKSDQIANPPMKKRKLLIPFPL